MSAAALLDDPLLSVMVRLVIGGVLERDDGRERPRRPAMPVAVPARIDLIGAAHDAARVEVGAAVLGDPGRFDLIAAHAVLAEPRPGELLGAVRAALRAGGTFVSIEGAGREAETLRLLAGAGFRDVTVAQIGDAPVRHYLAR
jgi:hypothetical protein